MVWGLSAWYLRKSDREFDPLAKRAADRALEISGGAPSGRFERTEDRSTEEVTRG
jgi:hypothetical protein